MQKVILVDENDVEVGTEEKIKAHIEGKLHRAFSIFVVNDNNQLLLQKRASQKYHSPGLWTNTCCSHPSPNESLEESVQKRLQEEMGFTCSLKWSFSFIYKASFSNGLTEHEYDHVFMGEYNGNPEPNPEEVEGWKWVDIDHLREDIKLNVHLYTYWFSYIFEKYYEKINKHLSSL